MEKIKILYLTDNLPVYLDDEDYEIISKMPGWYIHKSQNNNSRTNYAVHDKYGKLHRFILGLKDSNNTIIVDHIDRNGLNCQKNNLRITNTSINKRNSDTLPNNKFHFNGISYEKGTGNRSGRIKVSYQTNERLASNPNKFQQKNKSFTVSRFINFNECLRQAILFRIEKMKEFGYLLDERSETIEKECQNENVNLEELLQIKFSDII